jgi:hypothetical protein
MGNLPIMQQQEAIMIFFLSACVLMIGFVALHTRQPVSLPSPPLSGPKFSDGGVPVKIKGGEPTETTPLLLSSESTLFGSVSESSSSGPSDSSDSSDGSDSSDSWLSLASAGC